MRLFQLKEFQLSLISQRITSGSCLNKVLFFTERDKFELSPKLSAVILL